MKLIDYQPRGIPDGDVFIFEIDNKEIVVERWSTDASQGMDVYNRTDGVFADLGDETSEAIDALIDRVDALWAAAWMTHIYPIQERERLTLIEQMQEE
jgi:hypothetical protein